MPITDTSDRRPTRGSAPRRRLPDFLGIGAMRSGTTWLHRVLSTHPELFLSEEKELKFFDKSIAWESINDYCERFAGAGDRVCGEITPGYSTLKPESVRAIRALMPSAKAFLVLRNPVERAFSQLMFERGRRRGVKFERLPLWQFSRILERQRVRRRNDYDAMLTNWCEAFGDDLHVALYEQLIDDPAAHVGSICRHLGVAPRWDCDPSLLERRVLTTQEVEIPRELQWSLACAWLEPTRRASARLDGRLDGWVREMEAMQEGRWTWRLRRALTRGVASLPERAAYRVYDRWRDARFRRGYDQALRDMGVGPE